VTSGLVRGRCLFLPVRRHGERTVEFFFCRQTSTIHSQRFILLCKVDQVPPPSETYAVNLPSPGPCAPAASESPSPAPLNGVSVRWPDSNELVQAAANGVLFNTCPPFSPFTAGTNSRNHTRYTHFYFRA
jgi:hypothetical protein